MKKNSEVYKTAQERAEAFGKFCDGEQCYRCKLISYHSSNKNMCRFAWLDIESVDGQERNEGTPGTDGEVR